MDASSRETAEDLARRSGMTLNEWVSRLMADGPEDATSQDYFNQSSSSYAAHSRDAGSARDAGSPRYEAVHPADEIGRVTQAIERLSDRIATAESRQALAIASVERSVREVIGRIDAAEREQMQVAARFEGEVQDVKAESTRFGDRLRRMEEEAVGPRSAEALKALEGALGKVAGHVYEGDKHAREMLQTLRERVERLDGSEEATAGAIRDLKQSCTALDDRLNLAAAGNDGGVEQAAENLSARVEAVREDLSRQLADAADARFDRVEQALAEMSEHVRSAEKRSASAVERMGREVLEVAQTLSRRVHTVERTSAEAAERATAEFSRISGAVEDRLARTDVIQAQALEKLGAEIARITERLADRIANAERRSAQAIDDVGEQVARVTERVTQRQERSTTELLDRIRQSEERTARLLEEARQKIDDRLAETQRRISDAPPPQPQAQYDDADEALFGEAPFPGFETPPAERPAIHLPEPAFDVAPIYGTQASATFDDADFEAAVAGPEPDHTADMASEARPEPQAAYPTAPRPMLDLDHVELEPNVGFDVDDELIGPATHVFGEAPGVLPTAAAAHDSWAAIDHAAPDYPPAVPPTPGSLLEDDEDDDAFFDAATAHREQPIAEAVEAPVEEPIEETSALTTREVIERARAAARASNDREPRGAARPGDDSVLQSVSFGRSRKRTIGGTSGALMIASLLAAVGLSAGGYMLFDGKPGGKLPKRVADALSVVQSQVADATAPAQGSAPLAAVALAPKAIPQAAAPDMSQAYSAAVAKVSAGESSGLIAVRKLADGGYAPAQFYLAELIQDGKAGLKKDATESRRWLERAAEGGDRTAMHNLALDLHEGVGGARNAAQAAEWFRRAAELGLLDSQFNLAAIYEHGDGVSVNPAEAYKWYLIAGRSGDGEAKAGALRVRAGLTPDARAVAERAAVEFQPTAANPGTMPAAAPIAGSPDVVTAQRALNQLGYYQGPTDGVASQALHMALAAYQRDQSLPVSGNPDAATIGKLAVYTR
ncbi:MAG: peptidoglycan-binding protein [Caulobacteraceae bacterium]